MTDVMDSTATEDGAYDGDDQSENAYGGATYPEHHYSLADHVYTWSPKLPDGSMLVIRAQSADGLVKAVEDALPVVQRVMTAWRAATGTAQPAPQAPQFQGPGQGVNFNPPAQAPNQPFQGQPAWQQAGAPQAQAAPQWGGGAPQGQAQQRKEYPAPQGWYKLNVPFPGGKDQLHALAASLGIPKGNPAKGGAYNFFGLSPSGAPGKAWYCAPEAAQAFAQFNPMVG